MKRRNLALAAIAMSATVTFSTTPAFAQSSIGSSDNTDTTAVTATCEIPEEPELGINPATLGGTEEEPVFMLNTSTGTYYRADDPEGRDGVQYTYAEARAALCAPAPVERCEDTIAPLVDPDNPPATIGGTVENPVLILDFATNTYYLANDPNGAATENKFSYEQAVRIACGEVDEEEARRLGIFEWLLPLGLLALMGSNSGSAAAPATTEAPATTTAATTTAAAPEKGVDPAKAGQRGMLAQTGSNEVAKALAAIAMLSVIGAAAFVARRKALI